LPYVTFSGIFDKRKDDGLVKPSGLIICDLDHLPDPVGAKKAILESLMPALLFRSPSGDGLKIVFAIDLAVGEYTKYFEAIRIHFKTELHLILDNGKDLSRACFLCHDPDVFYSSSPVILDQDFLDTFLEDLPLAQDPNIITDIITEVPLKKSEIISGSPEALFKMGLTWIESQESFTQGNRHHFITGLSGFFHRNGLNKTQSISFLKDYVRPGFDYNEIEGIVSRIYSNRKYDAVTLLENKCSVESYLNFPLRLLWVSKSQLKNRIDELLAGSWIKTTGEIPTSIKKNYLLDVRNGKLDPELLLLLAAVRSIIGKRNYTRTTSGFIYNRMFGDIPWREFTRYWFDKLIDVAMTRGILTKLSGGPGFRGFYVSIEFKPEELSKKIINSLAYKNNAIQHVKKAENDIASFKKMVQEQRIEKSLPPFKFLRAI
jgi:hypothetical protein